jgi:hypothetical protein
MQKKRIFFKTLIFFQIWNEYHIDFYKKVFFLYFYRTIFIKLKFFRRFRKKFKKKFKKKKLIFEFFCKPNFLIHEKFKNARMGKGKGSPVMWVYRPHLNKPFAILSLLGGYRVNNIVSYLKIYLHKYIFIKKKYTWKI